MSIAQLLQAAEFLDRREREAEHGYASTLPMPEEISKRRQTKSSRKTQGNRSTHNELEKNRRANLRHCLDKLKMVVPLGSEATRHTTLGLLTKAKLYIRMLEDNEHRQKNTKEKLYREQRYLRRRLEALSEGQYRTARVERSISECSSSTTATNASSSSSNSSISSESCESDEIDILGYASSTSDTDDRISIRSNSSDGGCAVNTRRLLTLVDS